ncbi:hypothetical protein A3J90_00245 [candidate division WOR-1 bacterium RIFOXYC2_FULL_37_10]|uniref:Radical SAM core domain-containing protein n=1 Tax=candidate division WOR-1 bacterium RIFOXYB2_FULL_37_13 TaxID=1802579 RepID=A0A1F4SRR2_UNCSA|nr:MAG: hypothetical protein A2246_06315 [candidate division WOR-1 bacterium RIFOXYA2_FULL_37_7]OGC23132.1 MAG: hypothetical protein A2310_00870 [candidate division WOR-1 bacterium RIFOXYB2_FULL_37_13]OGC37293.1 MAG: hypothetical protein A3J90_00245 [candidate division WOR-1 bacterium RIFOXYC2_FULL_37_10]
MPSISTGTSRPTLFHKTAYGALAANSISTIMEYPKRYSDDKLDCMAQLWPSKESLLAFYDAFEGNIFFDLNLHNKPAIEPFLDWWQEVGLINPVCIPESTNQTERQELLTQIKKAIEKNPIINIDGVVVELTGLCNLRCQQCFRGEAWRDETEMSLDMLKMAIHPLLRAGIRRIQITGGEPTLRPDKLVGFLAYVKDYMYFGNIADTANTNSIDPYFDVIEINSNGTYGKSAELLERIRALGLTDLVSFSVSLDYPDDKQKTDQTRRMAGTYDKVIEFTETARSLGFQVDHLTLSDRSWANLGNAADYETNSFFSFDYYSSSLSFRLFDCGLDTPYFSLGKIRIRNGQAGFCQYAYALPEEFGNLTNHPIVEILNNGLMNSRSMRIISDGLERFVPEIDRNIFPKHFSSPCIPRNILLAYASWKEVFMEQGDSETAAIAKANRIVGIKYGYLPRETLLV